MKSLVERSITAILDLFSMSKKDKTSQVGTQAAHKNQKQKSIRLSFAQLHKPHQGTQTRQARTMFFLKIIEHNEHLLSEFVERFLKRYITANFTFTQENARVISYLAKSGAYSNQDLLKMWEEIQNDYSRMFPERNLVLDNAFEILSFSQDLELWLKSTILGPLADWSTEIFYSIIESYKANDILSLQHYLINDLISEEPYLEGHEFISNIPQFNFEFDSSYYPFEVESMKQNEENKFISVRGYQPLIESKEIAKARIISSFKKELNKYLTGVEKIYIQNGYTKVNQLRSTNNPIDNHFELLYLYYFESYTYEKLVKKYTEEISVEEEVEKKDKISVNGLGESIQKLSEYIGLPPKKNF